MKPKRTDESVKNERASSVAPVDIRQPPQDRAADLIKSENIEGLAKALTDSSSFINQLQSKNGKSLLTIAAEEGSIDAMKLLVKSGIDITLVDKTDSPAIIHASRFGYNKVVEFLIQVADINSFELLKRENALMTACRFKQEETAILLINSGISLTHTNENNDDALLTALKFQCFNVAKLLVEKGCSINSISSNGNRIITRCAFDNREDTLDFVLNCPEVDVNVKNLNGETALMIASRHGHDSIVLKLLQQERININEVDSFGRSALYIALASNKQATINLLLSSTMALDVNIADHFGVSPLMLACQKQLPILIVEKILKRGGFINSMDRSMFTPLMYACMCGSQDLISLLLRHGADSEATNIDNKRAIDLLSSKELQTFFMNAVEMEKPLPLTDNNQQLEAGKRIAPDWVQRLNNKDFIQPARRV